MTEQWKEQLIQWMKQPSYTPSTVHELQRALHIEGADDFKHFVKLLVEMEQKGDIVRSRANRYGLPEKMNFMRGRFIGHAKGFGFVVPETEGMDDIFIPPTETNGAMNGDTVLVRVSEQSTGDRREGEITRIVERKTSTVVGTFKGMDGYSYVVPDEKKMPMDILIKKGHTLGAMEGHKVLVEITEWPTEIRSATGIVTKVLGHKNDPGVDILSIVHKHDITVDFPEEVLQQANAIPDKVLGEQLEGRQDYRNELTVTIDGDDAKDLDDAIAVKKTEEGMYQLTVHISDVSYYVTEGSPMDVEAYDRGTSVYLTDRVIPMLPHKLSNGICSLNPDVDRLTMTCEMTIDATGTIVDHQIYESVIRSDERMTYKDVYHILEHEDPSLMQKYERVVPMLFHMKELAHILRTKRQARGSIDFNFKESKIIVDDKGWPIDIEVIERTVSERLIEEFMLAANETIAEHFHWLNVPFMYRIHENPKEARLEHFFEFLTSFGLSMKGGQQSVHPRALQQLLEEIEGTPEEPIISMMLLRSMQQAKYLDANLGHFGLSTEYYTHFTAPIRRYPDLIVHRLIRNYLIEGKIGPKATKKIAAKLPEIAEHTSARERRAVDAERDTESLKKAQFMLDKVGEQFEGIVSSVTNFGIFVELDNTVEGLIHVREMKDDYYRFDERAMMMIGERTAKQYRLGDVVEVVVTNVEPEEGNIDFAFVDTKPNRRSSQRPARERVFHKDGKRRSNDSKRKKAPRGNRAIAGKKGTPRRKKRRTKRK